MTHRRAHAYMLRTITFTQSWLDIWGFLQSEWQGPTFSSLNCSFLEVFVVLRLLIELRALSRAHEGRRSHPSNTEKRLLWQINKDRWLQNNTLYPKLESHSCGSFSDYRVENGIFIWLFSQFLLHGVELRSHQLVTSFILGPHGMLRERSAISSVRRAPSSLIKKTLYSLSPKKQLTPTHICPEWERLRSAFFTRITEKTRFTFTPFLLSYTLNRI